ncbi:MAG: ribose-phosphate pyrophosphokinase [Ruminococcaceae bacterium]|nr:ribose-phosphate pyrophosphokinase [Oscillospiraceae bacterium]
MNENIYGELSVIGMRGCEEFTAKIDNYLKEWRGTPDTSYVVPVECKRFGSGEAKCVLDSSLRGHDVYIYSDVFNYGVTFKMYGKEFPMSPDDHFQDLKRVISAMAGKARRISVIMPFLYESRQDKRVVRESLDCANALQELANMGVSNIVTFDVHNSSVQNSIPLVGFDNVHPTYQMIKALLTHIPDVKLDSDNMVIISPDEGGMGRCIYYSSVLHLDLGMFYKRRDYTRVVNGKNPIVAHEYLGKDVTGKDIIIIDDIISSGESMLDVATKMKARGARRIFIFASFGVFCEGLEKFDQVYADGGFTKIFTTNLIYRNPELDKREWYCPVDMTKYVSLIIDTLNHDNTISDIIRPVDRIHKLIEKVNSGEIKLQN